MGTFEQGEAVYTGDYGPWVTRLAERATSEDDQTRGVTQRRSGPEVPRQPDRADAELAEQFEYDQVATAEHLQQAAACSRTIGELVAAQTFEG